MCLNLEILNVTLFHSSQSRSSVPELHVQKLIDVKNLTYGKFESKERYNEGQNGSRTTVRTWSGLGVGAKRPDGSAMEAPVGMSSRPSRRLVVALLGTPRLLSRPPAHIDYHDLTTLRPNHSLNSPLSSKKHPSTSPLSRFPTRHRTMPSSTSAASLPQLSSTSSSASITDPAYHTAAMSYAEWKREPTLMQVLFGLQLPYRPPRSFLGKFLWRRRVWVEVTFALSMLEPWEKFLVRECLAL